MTPIWMVRTRMQPERRARGSKQRDTLQCAHRVYQTEGIRGFCRGLTASCAGISETIICFAIYETIICFAIYESLKEYLKEAPLTSSANATEKNPTNILDSWQLLLSLKDALPASLIPMRSSGWTRLREEGTKDKTFLQTARLVFREEGYLAFYRGLFAQLIRQIPNTATVLSTYELIVHLLEDRTQ